MKDLNILQKEKINLTTQFIFNVFFSCITLYIHYLYLSYIFNVGKDEAPNIIPYFVAGIVIMLIIVTKFKSEFPESIWKEIWKVPKGLITVTLTLTFILTIFSIMTCGMFFILFGFFVTMPSITYTVMSGYILFCNYKYGVFNLDSKKISTTDSKQIAGLIAQEHPEATKYMNKNILSPA